MSRKLVGAQAAFTVIAPALRGGSDPSKGVSGNPDVKWRTVTQQHFIEAPGKTVEGDLSSQTPGLRTRIGHVDYTTSPLPVNATGTVTVAGNTFAGPTTLQLGPYTLTSGVEFAVGATANDTATNLQGAIDALPGYSASVLAPVVTVTGPFGVIGNEAAFKAGGASPSNFTLSPDTGVLSGGDPSLGPVILT